MKPKTKRTRKQAPAKIQNLFKSVFFVLIAFAFYLIISFKSLSKEEQMMRDNKMTEDVESFRKNLTECARQVKASVVDVEHFLKRIPQANMPGKCFVACLLNRNELLKDNKISKENFLDANRAVYGEDREVMALLKTAIGECTKAIDGIFEVCEYASVFHDCMLLKMEHILDQVMMERRKHARGQIRSQTDQWGDAEDEIMKLVKDEL